MHAWLTLCLSLAAGLQESRKVEQIPEGFTLVAATLRFSADGTKVAYVAKKEDEQYPVIGHTVGKGYARVRAPVIDRAGEHVAFRTLETKRSGDPLATVLFDGKELASAEWIGPIALAPSDGTPAFWTGLGHQTEADGSLVFSPVQLVFGKKKSAKWQTVDDVLAPAFSPDGQRVFSVGTKDEDWGVIALDRKGGEKKHSGGHLLEVFCNPNGREIACTAFDPSLDPRDLADALLRDKFIIELRAADDLGQSLRVLGKSFDSAGSLAYGPDGEHFAFKALRGDKMGVSVDGDDVECTWDWVDELTLAPVTHEIAYVAAKGCTLDEKRGWQVLADMVETTGGRWCVVRGTTASAEYDATRDPTWSPDGTQLAFAAKANDGWRVIVGERQSPACDEIARIEWSADGKGLWYGMRNRRELWWSWLPLE